MILGCVWAVQPMAGWCDKPLDLCGVQGASLDLWCVYNAHIQKGKVSLLCGSNLQREGASFSPPISFALVKKGKRQNWQEECCCGARFFSGIHCQRVSMTKFYIEFPISKHVNWIWIMIQTCRISHLRLFLALEKCNGFIFDITRSVDFLQRVPRCQVLMTPTTTRRIRTSSFWGAGKLNKLH